jgi:chromosome segregation ATPase
MMQVASGVPAGTEKGLSLLLDLIANPAKAAEAKASLDALTKAQADADAAIEKANALEAANKQAMSDITKSKAAIDTAAAGVKADADILAEAKAAHEKAVAEHRANVATANKALAEAQAALAKQKAAQDARELEISKRENQLVPREKAADQKFAAGEAVINKAKSLGLTPIGV